MKVLVTDRAQSDLLGVYDYVAQDNPEAAIDIVRKIDEMFHRLESFPFIGRARARFGKGVRSATVGVHLIFYVTDNEAVTILRVIDGRRDIDAALRS